MNSKNLRFILNETRRAYDNPLAKRVMGSQSSRIMEIFLEAQRELDELERVVREAELRGLV
jgi:hypothetical protein